MKNDANCSCFTERTDSRLFKVLLRMACCAVDSENIEETITGNMPTNNKEPTSNVDKGSLFKMLFIIQPYPVKFMSKRFDAINIP
jgi:hypothetical protein